MVLLFALAGLVAESSACGTDCQKLKQQAQALVSEYAACSAGDTCQVVNLYDIAGANNCLGAFQCSTAVRQGADLGAFKSRARAIVDEYRSGCNECATASCVDPSSATAKCNTTTGHCEITW